MATNALALKQQFSLAPTNFEEAWKFAEIIAKSAFAPKNFIGKPGDVFCAVQMGAELGLSPMQAMQNIAPVNGKPSVYGDAIPAICMGHPSFVSIKETLDEKTMIATCVVVRKGMDPVVRTFSVEDAKMAKLWGKQGPWSDYPKRMLQMRARGFACRDAFPDALRGIISREEAEDMPPVQATTVKVDRPAPAQEKLSPEAEVLQAEFDKPREERHAAIDPELDPEDYVIKANGKNKDKPLSSLGTQALEWYAENSRDQELKLYANAALMQRKAADIVAGEARKAEQQEMIANDSWGMSGEQEGVSP